MWQHTDVPPANEQGAFSQIITPAFEQFYVSQVRSAATSSNLNDVSDRNAGQLLHIILTKWKEAGQSIPPNLSTLKDCNQFIKGNAEAVHILKKVHQQSAYTWLIETNLLSPPAPFQPSPSLTIKNYIFPKETKFKPAILGSITCAPSGTSSAYATCPFLPRNLQHSRLPYNVFFVKDFAKKMKSHLETLLDRKYAYKLTLPPSQKLKTNYDRLRDSTNETKEDIISSEDEVHTFGVDLMKPVQNLFHLLTEHRLYASGGQAYTVDGSVRTDRLVRENKKQGPIRVVIEEKSVGVGRYFIKQITALSKNSEKTMSLSFHNDVGLRRWDDEKAIIGKLCWHATDVGDSKNWTRWCVLFAGDEYMCFLLAVAVDANGQPRPLFYCSGKMKVADSTFNMCTALLYMALTSRDIEQPELLEALHISLPTDLIPALPDPPSTPELDAQDSGTPDKKDSLADLEKAERVVLIFDTGIRTMLRRDMVKESQKGETRSSGRLSQAANRWPEIRLKGGPIMGGVSVVFGSQNDVMVKLNLKGVSESRNALRLEWEIYQMLAEQGRSRELPINEGGGAENEKGEENEEQEKNEEPEESEEQESGEDEDEEENEEEHEDREGEGNGGVGSDEEGAYTPADQDTEAELKIPKLYGIFGNLQGDDLAIIISAEGKPLPNFETLKAVEKKQIWGNLLALHKAGVLHNDFEPRNVLRGPRGLVIIDFSHSIGNHRCPGVYNCQELVNVHRRLWGSSIFSDNMPTTPSLSTKNLKRTTTFVPSHSNSTFGLRYLSSFSRIRIWYWITCALIIVGYTVWSL